MPPAFSPFIALTDKAWFDFLTSRAHERRVDEVNFWSPSSSRPQKRLTPGEPFFFRLKHPHNAIAGYGFFAHFALLSLDETWTYFGWKNGDPDKVRFLERIGGYRGKDLLVPGAWTEPLGCTILRDATFWPAERWIPWHVDQGWAPNIVRGKTERDAARASRLLAELSNDQMGMPEPEEFGPAFEPLDVDERELQLARMRVRVGQGTFRSRLITTWNGSCAITGEHTQPVLDAAHIQPYLGPRSNHLQNGLLLCQEFHTLFDRGYVTVTPDLVVRVSSRLREDWENGKRYYAFDKQRLRNLPEQAEAQPSPSALEWHGKRIFLG